jgi:asparagine synthase (glutamine-hydrolysing)
MCGIAGYAGDPDRLRTRSCVESMVASLVRRGPDGEGLETWPEAALGHRRLAIFDLSAAGRQPMLSEDRALGVVFNGAIYNFLDLRAALEASGCRFRSHTDTEVLIHGYREWGIQGLVSRLRGMFAFGLWDDSRRKLFLVRDRLGVKPLVYTAANGTLAFASTTRALRDAGLAADIDDEAVSEFLEFGYVTDQRTIYAGVRKLEAATVLEWSGGEIRTHRYWFPAAADESSKMRFEEAVEETERLFVQAVKLRLEADVPVGALLSGGVDSALVCWAISKLGGNVQAFTIGAPNDPWDETAEARDTAARLNIEHRVIEVSAADAPGVDELVSAYGEPFACASALGMLRVSRAVKPFATVLLTGDGGDDVFLGYPEHKNLWLAQRLARRIPPAGKLWPAVRPLIPKKGILKRAANFLEYATGGLGAVTRVHDGLPLYWKHGMLGDRLRDATVVQRGIPRTAESARNLLPEFLEYDRRTRFAGEYLTKVDGGSMHYGLEARSPFLDQELWNFAAALPFRIRLRGGALKAVLRELARRRIGARVASGPKRGFGVPVQRWIAGGWRTPFEDWLRNSLLEKEGYIRPETVRARLHAASQKGEAPVQLWYLYVLEAWLRQEHAARGETYGAARLR